MTQAMVATSDLPEPWRYDSLIIGDPWRADTSPFFICARATPLVAHRLRWCARIDGLAGLVVLTVVTGEIVLRIKVCAADDAVVLVRVFHVASSLRC